MILWAVLTLMVALAAVGITVPLVRRHDSAGRGSTLAVLKAQLEELEAQSAAGAMTSQEAEGLRAEIRRRILAEARTPEAATRPLPAPRLVWVALGLAAVVAVCATALYAMLGRPDLVAQHPAPPAVRTAEAGAPAAAHPGGDVAGMIAQLEAQMQKNPKDPEGWRLLAWSYLETGRAAEAANAYGRAAALDPKNAGYLSAEGDALVQAAGGDVTDAALKAFHGALAIDTGDPRARYFLAVAKDQQGDHAGAMADWIALVNSAPADAPWAGEVRDFVERTAKERNIDLAGKLKPAPAATPAAPRPTPDQVAAAGQMNGGDQMTMIRGMVDKLAGELKANPDNADGWQRLMRAHMVLGETEKAAGDYRDAQKAFAKSPQQLAALRDAARSLGVPGSGG